MNCSGCIYFFTCEKADSTVKKCEEYKNREMHLVKKDGEKYIFESLSRN